MLDATETGLCQVASGKPRLACVRKATSATTKRQGWTPRVIEVRGDWMEV